MADDQFQIGSGNWWDSPRNRFDRGPSPSSSSALSTSGSFGWPTELVDLKARSSMDSVSVSVSVSDSASGSNVLADSTLQMMGLGLSSQTMDWNQPLLQGAKTESSFRSLLQEDQLRSTANFQQETGMGSSSQEQWRHNHRGFSLDQRPVQFGSHISSSSDGVVTCQGLVSTSFQMDPASASYGVPSTILQGLLGTEHHSQQQQQQQQQQLNNYSYPMTYGMSSSHEIFPSNSWSKFPQFVRNSPPKQHHSNPFWNANAANSMTDVRSSFFPILQPQFPPPNFDEKPKNISDVRELKTVVKKSISSSEQSNKRPRSEASSAPLPAFKVRKEKMGDRITALQQLVSPFGKTDTASVLSEAIEYIKFLHEQVNVLSTPYMKSGASMQHQHHQNSDKSKEAEGAKQDLRSRGLCLVPVSSTFPVTHETTVDFWNPTFGGTFR